MKQIPAALLFAPCVVLFAQSGPSDETARKILADRIDQQKQSVGIVAGVIDAGGRRIISHGTMAKGDPRPVNGDTLYEIGSITKVFTSLLLADAVVRKEVALTDPVSKYLPDSVKMPERNGRAVTLVDLATHTSALPRMPGNFKPANPSDPYADYTAELLFQFLPTITLSRDIGEKYEYSNLAVGLLGTVLARRSGMTYENLLRARVLNPLGMKSTYLAVPASEKGRFATGHDGNLNPVSYWALDALAGAGAIRSSVNDMLIFMAAAAGHTKTPLADAFATMLATRRNAGNVMDIALGWHIFKRDPEVVWHNGGTGGFRTFAGYNDKTKVGIVVLSNTSTQAGVDDIGRHLLDSSFPLMAPVKQRKEISLDEKILKRYPGKYELAPGFALTVTLEDGKLFTQATGQGKLQVFPETERDFFLKVVDAQLTFQADAEGKVTGVVLHQGGRDLPGKKVE